MRRAFRGTGAVIVALSLGSGVLRTAAADPAQQAMIQCHTWSQAALPTQAARICEEALKEAERTYPRESSYLLYPLNDLTTIYFALGDFGRAEQFALRAFQIGERTLGARDPRIVTLMTALAAVYQQQARYQPAESLYRRALATTQDALGAQHLEVANVLHNLALLQQAQGRYDAAEPLLLRALRIRESQTAKDSISVATTLLALAAAYQQQGMLAQALPLYDRALSIYQKAYGPKAAQLAGPLQNMAALLQLRGQLTEAEPIYQRALSILEMQPETPPLELARLYENLGVLYQAQGQHTLAQGFQERGLSLRERTLGKIHPLVAESLHSVALNALATAQPSVAVPLLWRAITILEAGLRLALSEAQTAALLGQQRGIEESAYGALVLFPDSRELKQLAMAIVLLRKGRSEEAGERTNLATQAAARSGALASQLLEWQRARAERERLILQGPGALSPSAYRARFESLRLRIEDLELALLSASEQGQTRRVPIPKDIIPQVAAKLEKGSVLIEIVWTHPLLLRGDEEGGRARPHYVALVLHPNLGIESFDLGEAAALEERIGTLLRRLQERAIDPRPAAEAAYRAILGPMEPSLASTRRIYVSADGGLHLIPFAALHDGSRYLIDRHQFVYLTSGRDLLADDLHPAGGPPVVIADPDFTNGASPSEAAPAAAGPAPSEPAGGRAITGLYSEIVSISRLPGTRQEAELLSKLWPEAQVLLDRKAEETAVRRLQAPLFLHIATHGVFLQDSQAPGPGLRGARGMPARAMAVLVTEPGTPEQPGQAPKAPAPAAVRIDGGDRASALSRSALLLAGAESASRSRDRAHDGLLTAEEVRGMNLWGTRLVVLSACESGRGAIRVGEGVYGLRRAFFSAGAETLVTSLWRVADSQTSELMTEYYQRLAAGGARIASLGEAMAAVRKRHPHPYYWAPFIGIGRDAPIRSTGSGAATDTPPLPEEPGAGPGRPRATKNTRTGNP